MVPVKVKITSAPRGGDGSSGDLKGDESTSAAHSSGGNSFDKEYEIDHGAQDNLLVVLPDGSTLSADPNQMKSSQKLLLVKRDANGKVDPSFQPDPIAFFTSPFFASWHEIRCITPLRNNSYLLTTLSGYNGAGAFRYMHIFKINETGKIDRKFGTKGTVAFEADSTGLNYRFFRYLVERTDEKLVGLEHRCVPERSSSYGQCERFFFRLTKDGKIDRTFGKNGFAAVDSYEKIMANTEMYFYPRRETSRNHASYFKISFEEEQEDGSTKKLINDFTYTDDEKLESGSTDGGAYKYLITCAPTWACDVIK